MVVTHSEFFSSVVSTGAGFQCSSFALNPGFSAAFPWLGPVAARYETYKFRSIRIRYHPSCPTSSAGSVMLGLDFDPADPPPVDQRAVLNYKDYAVAPVWADSTLVADLRSGDRLPSKYVRVGSIAGTDIKTYDVANLHVCLEGVAAATVGLLFIDYTVELFTPQIADGIGGTWQGSTGLDATHLVGDNTGVVSANLPFVWTDSATLTFDQPFEGLIGIKAVGTGLATPFAFAGSTCTVSNLASGFTGSTIGACYVRVKAQKGQTIVATTTATTVSAVAWRIASAPYAQLGL